MTVVVADDIIYMGRENFHHWPLPRLQGLPPKESLEPPFSSVERKDITDVEQIVSFIIPFWSIMSENQCTELYWFRR